MLGQFGDIEFEQVTLPYIQSDEQKLRLPDMPYSI